MTDARGRPPGAGGPPPRMEPATARARATARALAVARALVPVFVVLAAAALGGCGGEAADEVTGEKYVGFWRAADVALADCTLVKVWREGDAYHVRVDYEAPRPAALGAGGLRVGASASETASPEVGGDALDAAGGDDTLGAACELLLSRGTLVLVRPVAGASPLEVVLRSVSEAAYEEELAAMSDDRVRIELMELAAAVQAWAEVHGDRPPAADLLAPDSEFARSLGRLGTGWPTNPFTAEPMHAGDGPGDFAYSTAGRDFELLGYLSDGAAYAAE